MDNGYGGNQFLAGLMSGWKSNTLSFELVVVSVDGLLVNCQRPAVIFQFLDYSQLLIRPRRDEEWSRRSTVRNTGAQAGTKQETESGRTKQNGRYKSLPFNSGKSCLFRMAPEEVKSRLEDAPLCCLLVDERNSPVILLGCCTLQIAPAIWHVVQSGNTKSVTKELHCQPVVNFMGSRVASMHIRYRLTLIGPSINCHLQQANAGQEVDTPINAALGGGEPASKPHAGSADGSQDEISGEKPRPQHAPGVGSSELINPSTAKSPAQNQEHRHLLKDKQVQVEDKRYLNSVKAGCADDVQSAATVDSDQCTLGPVKQEPLPADAKVTKPAVESRSYTGAEYVPNTLCPPPMLFTSQDHGRREQREQGMDSGSENERYRAIARKLASDSQYHHSPVVVPLQTESTWQTVASRADNNYPIIACLFARQNSAESGSQLLTAGAAAREQKQDDLTEPAHYAGKHHHHLRHQGKKQSMCSQTVDRSHATAEPTAPVLAALLRELLALLGSGHRDAANDPSVAYVPERTGVTVHGAYSRPKQRSGHDWLSKHHAQEDQQTRLLARSVYSHLLREKAASPSPDLYDSPVHLKHQLSATEVLRDVVMESESDASLPSSTTFLPAAPGAASISPTRWQDHGVSRPCSSRGSDSASPKVGAGRRKVLRKRSSSRVSLHSVPQIKEPSLADDAITTHVSSPSPAAAQLPQASLRGKRPLSETGMMSLKPPGVARVTEEHLTNISDSSTCLPKVLVFLPSHTDTGGSGGSGGRPQRPPVDPAGKHPSELPQRKAAPKGRMKRRKSLLDAWPGMATSSAVSGDSDYNFSLPKAVPPLRSPLSKDAPPISIESATAGPDRLNSDESQGKPATQLSPASSPESCGEKPVAGQTSSGSPSSPSYMSAREALSAEDASDRKQFAANMSCSSLTSLASSPHRTRSPFSPEQVQPITGISVDTDDSSATPDVDYDDDKFEDASSTDSSLNDSDGSNRSTDKEDDLPRGSASSAASVSSLQKEVEVPPLPIPDGPAMADDASSTYDINTEDIIISDELTSRSWSMDTSQIPSARSLPLVGEEPDLQSI